MLRRERSGECTGVFTVGLFIIGLFANRVFIICRFGTSDGSAGYAGRSQIAKKLNRRRTFAVHTLDERNANCLPISAIGAKVRRSERIIRLLVRESEL